MFRTRALQVPADDAVDDGVDDELHLQRLRCFGFRDPICTNREASKLTR